MKPQYTITSQIAGLLTEIARKLGQIEGAELDKAPIQLRRTNRIKTISSTLQIEGNTLTLDQVTDFVEGKRIIAPQKDITEVKNALAVYDHFADYKPYSLDSIRKAHKTLMRELIPDAGAFRTKAVGIAKGDEVSFIAPPAHLVPTLLKDLLGYVRRDKDPILIKSCVFHFEFEFIHPFSDGNGRMGRLWQSVLLAQYHPFFEYLPIETLIKQRQSEYYRVFDISHAQGECTAFVQFMLSVINDSLDETLRSQQMPKRPEERLARFLEGSSLTEFTRSDYLGYWPKLSAATASRDLKRAVESGSLDRVGDKSTTKYKLNR